MWKEFQAAQFSTCLEASRGEGSDKERVGLIHLHTAEGEAGRVQCIATFACVSVSERRSPPTFREYTHKGSLERVLVSWASHRRPPPVAPGGVVQGNVYNDEL